MISDDRIKYWNTRYSNEGNSGAGSDGLERNFKIEQLRKLDNVDSILDVGCGDFRTGELVVKIFPFASYLGLDISENIIDKCKKKAEELNLRKRYNFQTINNYDFKDTAELVLCLDVLFHQLDDDQYKNLIDKLKSSYTKYLVLTEYSHYQAGKDNGKDIKHRLFYPEDISDEWISYKIKEGTGNKILYIFKK